MIQVKAFAVLLDERGTRHVVWRGSDPSKSPGEFHRLLGGHVNFGETSRAAVVREIGEELGVELLEPHLLGVLESIFEYDGRPGHEVVFVYAGQMSNPDVVPAGGATFVDSDADIRVEWRPIDADALPLYPDGVEELIAGHLATSGSSAR
ncbi:MAG TPA: NUDIX domain-containing protein [Nocardioidaceae bacterium]|nr:NUDIX domain-containing protein [Nocardioidaceae bacterium]